MDKVAVLRFENLTGDPDLDWMGRAFSDVITRELAVVPNTYAIPLGRLHNVESAFGGRPGAAPGVSAERDLASASGANRAAYGEYWRRNGRLETRVTLAELPGERVVRVITASAQADDVVGAASQIARQLSSQAGAYSTRDEKALRAYAEGVDANEPSEVENRLEEAIAHDPNFGQPYDLLAQVRLRRRDRGGAVALLDQALSRGGSMAAVDRAQVAFAAADLRGDAVARRQALASWAVLTPSDPAIWRATAEAATSRHEYSQAIAAYQKALSISPDDVSLLNQMGYAAAYAGDLAASTRALGRYAVLRPSEANPLDSLGDTKLLSGDLRGAEILYLDAAKKDASFQGGGEFLKAAVARLMTGDISGADAMEQQYLARRVQFRDPLVDFYKAEWAWMSGRRKEAFQVLESFARRLEEGPLRQAASEAYSELAVWKVALGERNAAAQMAKKADMLAGPASAGTSRVAQFLSQGPALPAAWAERATRVFPEAPQKPIRDFAQAYALLADRQFAAALPILRSFYDTGAPGNAEGIPVLLAWAYLETGQLKEAAGLLRFNPLPAASGVQPFRTFYFPRLFYLRGRLAAQSGNPDQARVQYQLFLRLSGDQPLAWGEEALAH